MTAARRRAFLIALLGIAVAAAAFAWRTGQPSATRDRPTLLLLTSLPIVFGEGFSLDDNGSPVLEALETRYRVLPIATSAATELAQGRLLLMAQPNAQTAEDLVALDDWVRGGGRVLLLADPLLEWPDRRPVGDVTRPIPMFMDTGLLQHWGLRLDLPDKRGPREASIGGLRAVTVSPGALHGACAIGDDRIVARCRIGRGIAVVIADADLIDPGRADQLSGNLASVLAELGALEGR